MPNCFNMQSGIISERKTLAEGKLLPPRSSFRLMIIGETISLPTLHGSPRVSQIAVESHPFLVPRRETASDGHPFLHRRLSLE